jgi:thiosulfate dehydrogenase (quinone) large subunit
MAKENALSVHERRATTDLRSPLGTAEIDSGSPARLRAQDSRHARPRPATWVKGVAVVRVLFGLAWVIDASLKWSPTFRAYFVSYISSEADGQPQLVRDWIGWTASFLGHDPTGFVYAVAVAESLIAISLILGAFTTLTCIVGSLLSLGIWTTAEGLGGPYQEGTTDVGTSIIYVLTFAALAFAGAGGWAGLDRTIRPRLSGNWRWLSSAAQPDAPPEPGRAPKLAVAALTAAALAFGSFVSFDTSQLAPMTSAPMTSAPMTSAPTTSAAMTSDSSTPANESQQTTGLSFYANVGTSSARTSEVAIEVTLKTSPSEMFNPTGLTGYLVSPSGKGPGIPVNLESTMAGEFVSWGLAVPDPGEWKLHLTVKTADHGNFALSPVTIHVVTG